MKALILAAGFGIRLREVVHGRPKHLAPIHGKPFLYYLIDLLKKNGITDVVIAVGYLSSLIIEELDDGKRFGINIEYSVDSRPMGTAGTVKHADKYFKQDFLVINGDTYLDIDFQDLYNFHKRHRADITIVATTKRKGKSKVEVRGEKVINFYYNNSGEKMEGEILENAGVYIFHPQILKLINPGEKSSLEKDFFPQLIKLRKTVIVYKTEKEYIDIGTPDHYHEAEKRLKGI